MKNQLTLGKYIIAFTKWFAGFFEDQRGSGSSKRIALYVNTVCLYQQNQYSMKEGSNVNFYVLIVLFVIELVLLGVIAKEFFLKYGIPLVTKSSFETNNEGDTKITQEETTVTDAPPPPPPAQ